MLTASLQVHSNPCVIYIQPACNITSTERDVVSSALEPFRPIRPSVGPEAHIYVLIQAEAIPVNFSQRTTCLSLSNLVGTSAALMDPVVRAFQCTSHQDRRLPNSRDSSASAGAHRPNSDEASRDGGQDIRVLVREHREGLRGREEPDGHLCGDPRQQRLLRLRRGAEERQSGQREERARARGRRVSVFLLLLLLLFLFLLFLLLLFVVVSLGLLVALGEHGGLRGAAQELGGLALRELVRLPVRDGRLLGGGSSELAPAALLRRGVCGRGRIGRVVFLTGDNLPETGGLALNVNLASLPLVDVP